MKRVIITGANGFIGSALTAYLSRQGIDIYAVIKDADENIAPISGLENVHLIYCDILNVSQLADLVEEKGFDCFYHLAWIGVSSSFRRDEKLQLSNVTAAAECVRAAQAIGCRKFVGIGSFMEKEALISVETQGVNANPSYIYGLSKLFAKSVAKLTAGSMDMDFCWGVITNAFGIGNMSEGFISFVLRNVIERSPIRLTSCEQIYDFLYIDDVAKALYLIGEHGRHNKEYIIGSGNARPLKEFVNEILRTLDAESLAEFSAIPFQGVSVSAESMNTPDLREDCFFEPEVPFADGIRMTYEWMKTRLKEK